jgi:hypothetical protein
VEEKVKFFPHDPENTRKRPKNRTHTALKPQQPNGCAVSFPLPTRKRSAADIDFMATITATIPVLCDGVRLSAQFSYSSGDPYAITANFHDQGIWVFARDLITEALMDQSAGLGDVRVDATERFVCFSVGDPLAERVVVIGMRGAVERFLRDTHDNVPAGSEHKFLSNWDDCLPL